MWAHHFLEPTSRSGIEPLIGHAKQGGQLGKSRMKKDESTLAAGYAAVGASISVSSFGLAGQRDQSNDVVQTEDFTQ